MATLKINSYIRTHWITDVEEVIEMATFPAPKFDGEPEDDSFDPVVALLKDTKQRGVPFSLPSAFSVLEFRGRECPEGKAIYVKTRGQSEGRLYLIPSRSAFLMADNGRTVDRI